MKKLLKRFIPEEQGLESVEYAVLAALIIVALIGVIGAMTAGIHGVYANVTANLPPAAGG
jgi:Flp pilus assembly pilin Flp